MRAGLSLFVISGAALLLPCSCTGPLDNPSDSKSSKFTVESEATVSPIGGALCFQFDTVAFRGGLTSERVEKAGLVKEYAWDFGNDGDYDTILTGSDTSRMRLTEAGVYSIAVRLRDGLGNTSRATTTILVMPTIETACAFYSQNEYTMRPVLLLGRYLTFRNKTESMTLGNFIFELLKNLAGTLDISVLTLPLKRSFDGGVYTIGNDSITISAVFHYGPGVEGHAENDTIRDDLFNPQSYVRSFRVQTSAPYYSYEQGPLWHLAGGFSVDVSNPLNPKYSFTIAMADLKFSCYREVRSRYTMSSEISDTGVMYSTFEEFLFNYHGIARIRPFRVGNIEKLLQTDSLEIDMAGSQIATDSLPMTFTWAHLRDTLRGTIDFNMTQTILEQPVRFGNSGGRLKVLGSYAAQSEMSINDKTYANIHFSGTYSTAAADTARFYCEEERVNRFGTLYFDVPEQGWSTFVSERYNYRFTLRQSLVTLAE
ncbi:MAG: hypothetical protein JW913_06495 [Chitinispirillaceae bacterium]|nr:hypothetical protein [Chitinispirillaceae bacterium]